MACEAEPGLSWTDHYVRHGFAVAPGLVGRDFCAAAVDRVKEIIGATNAPNEWTTGTHPVLYSPFFEGGNAPDPIFERLFEEPLLREAIEEMYGGAGHWDERKNYYLFLRPFNPESRRVLAPRGHIDFPGQGVPVLYRGFTFQVLLADNEAFGGNLTLYPGTHRVVQKALLDDPALPFPNGTADLPSPPPVEFVGKAGDACFMHHLVFHSGNENAAAHRSPRIAIHAEAFREAWLTGVDPGDPALSPWERSLALNGTVTTTPEIERENMRKRREYVEGLRKKDVDPAATST
jgi:hypothetical protein